MLSVQNQLYTRWGRTLDPENILPEYPRPQFVRTDFQSLNGKWDYAFTKAGDHPESWHGKILVPFSPESALSGVGKQLMPDEWLWLERSFRVSANRRVLLHFGAVDQSCAVYINGKTAARHTGGYTPFSADVTSFLKEGENRLTVCIRDKSDTSFHARGKQKLNRGGMYYTATSGIWQSVWLEEVPAEYLERIDSDFCDADGTVRITPRGTGTGGSVRIRIFEPGIYRDKEFPAERVFEAFSEKTLTASSERTFEASSENTPKASDGGAAETSAGSETLPGVICDIIAKNGEEICIPLPEIKKWSPDEPWLYYFLAEYGEDKVLSYFGARSFSVENDGEGIPRLMMNGKPVFMKGVLDQGYWPDGLLTPPSDEALLFDISEMKKTGFNMARKHAKVETERWYCHCDRMGLFVWQDIVNGGEPYADWYVTYLATFLNAIRCHPKDSGRKLLSRESAAGRRQFEKDMEETVLALKNHPCIAVWVLFNEGWGQFDTVRLTTKLKQLDPSRPVDSASGWFDQKCGDFISMHHYFGPMPWKTDGKRAVVLSEFGGYALHIDGHSAVDKVYGYRIFKTEEDLESAVRELIRERENLEKDGLCAYVYTQWSDIEEEVNGVFTYDREVRKIKPEKQA